MKLIVRAIASILTDLAKCVAFVAVLVVLGLIMGEYPKVASTIIAIVVAFIVVIFRMIRIEDEDLAKKNREEYNKVWGPK